MLMHAWEIFKSFEARPLDADLLQSFLFHNGVSKGRH